MERRRAVAIAAVTAATTLGAVAAIAANFGLLGFGTADADPVGKLIAGRTAEVVSSTADPTTPIAGPNATVRYEDIYLPAPASPAATATPVATPAANATPVATSAAADPGAFTAGDGATVPSGHEVGDDHDESRDEHADHEVEDD
jgi:hypothetical protein